MTFRTATRRQFDEQFPGLSRPSRYLRAFNVFAQQDSNGVNTLVVPKFVRNQINNQVIITPKDIEYSRLLENSVIPAISRSMEDFNSANVVVSLKELMTADVIMKSGIDELLMHCDTKLNQWSGKAPKVNPKGAMGIKEILGCVKSKSFSGTKTMKPGHLGLMVDALDVGDAIVFEPKSVSADVLVKVSGKLLLEFQCKLEEKKLSFNDIKTEILKSVVVVNPTSNYTSLFVYLKSEGVDVNLVLRAGNYNERLELCEGDEESALTVPPNMMVLIPSSKQVQMFIGERLFSGYRNTQASSI
jgi:hypothetical protein